MRLECEIETPSAGQHDTAVAAAAPERIDLDRVVWDPEYRDQVLEDMKAMG